MTVRITAEVSGDLGQIVRGNRDLLAQDVTLGIRAVTAGAVQDMRQEMARAFPNSRRMATMITGKAAPEGARYSLDAAGRVFGRGGKRSAWPAPLWALAFGGEIAARDGGSLAIPTKAVPRDSRNRALTPAEVEARFGEKLKAIPPGRIGKLGALVLEGQTMGRSGRVRAATAGRARQGRAAQPIVMFWLTRSVTLPSKWDPRAIMGRWAALAPELVERARAAREQTQREGLVARAEAMRQPGFRR